jgi:hypothetical protein
MSRREGQQFHKRHPHHFSQTRYFMFSLVSLRKATLWTAVVTATALAAACRSPRPTYAKYDAALKGVAPALAGEPPVVAMRTVRVELSEWKVAIADAALAAGPVTFQVQNGMEKKTKNIEPNSTASLTVELKAGHYDAYCPVAGGAHKTQGMLTDISVSAN